MALQELLGSLPVAEFVERILYKQPFALRGGAAHLVDRGDWNTIERILESADADYFFARNDARVDTPKPTPAPEARRMVADGATLVIRRAHRHDKPLAQLASSFARDFHAEIDVQMFCTPAGERGFNWHYDAEDVFILQTQGSKTYSLRKNTVNPWPLVETIPLDMAYEREQTPIMECSLDAGDWLYIPSGFWHRTHAREESISLAVGVMAPAATDVVAFAAEYLRDRLPWRRRLPATGLQPDDAALIAALREHLAQIADELPALLADETFLRAYVERRKAARGG